MIFVVYNSSIQTLSTDNVARFVHSIGSSTRSWSRVGGSLPPRKDKQKARPVIRRASCRALGGDGGSRTPVQSPQRKISYKLSRYFSSSTGATTDTVSRDQPDYLSRSYPALGTAASRLSFARIRTSRNVVRSNAHYLWLGGESKRLLAISIFAS